MIPHARAEGEPSPLPDELVLEPGSKVSDFDGTPPCFREVAAVLVTVILADLALYRGQGYAGMAALLGLTPIVWLLGAPQRRNHRALWILSGMLWLLGARLVWFGSSLQVATGLILLVAVAVALAGQAPYVVAVLVMASQAVLAGYRAFLLHARAFRHSLPHIQRVAWLNVALPLAAFAAFATLFVLANPDAVAFLGRNVESVLTSLRDWLVRAALRPTEILFWLAVAWFTWGLLRPVADFDALRPRPTSPPSSPHPDAPLYPAARNTLITVITLFAVYLVIEYKTLWFREIPAGFYYAGYAHEGAAWLTIALALATVILSLVFSGRMLLDSRLASLRRLAWVWSLQNVLLSLAVYHRLFIYIGFNGLTRMRIVGLFGITLVMAGFLLVILKIARNMSFSWLVQRQLWALSIAIYLFALTPVDAIAVSYNVRSILHGNSSACMQIGTHELDSEGILALPPLLSCADSEICAGVKALLAQRHDRLKLLRRRREQLGWTAFQLADDLALERLDTLQHHWRAYESPAARTDAFARFRQYAFQWY